MFALKVTLVVFGPLLVVGIVAAIVFVLTGTNIRDVRLKWGKK